MGYKVVLKNSGIDILRLEEALRKRRDELFAVARKTAEGFKNSISSLKNQGLL